jgi:hypothetical protein
VPIARSSDEVDVGSNISDDRAHYGHHSRRAFDEFMLAVTDTKVTDMPEKDGRGRRAVATAAYNHILRRVGARR